MRQDGDMCGVCVGHVAEENGHVGVMAEVAFFRKLRGNVGGGGFGELGEDVYFCVEECLTTIG